MGKPIVKIDRILYATAAGIETDDGGMELTLEGGHVLLFECDSNGQSLRVTDGIWVDPFGGALDQENLEYIAHHGKWTRIPCSSIVPYRDLVGASITKVAILMDQFGYESGIGIHTSAHEFYIVAEGDETHVYWARPLGYVMK